MNIEKIEELLRPHHSDDINVNRESLVELIEILGDFTHNLHVTEEKVESWEYYFETIIHKIIFHSQSICRLSEGILLVSHKFKKEANIIDSPSIYILTRAVIEAFLTLEYIYFSQIPEEEKLFRFKLWEVSGISSRQGFEIDIDTGLQEKKKIEKELIESLMIAIKKDPKYSTLNNRQRNNVDNYRLPRILGWHDLINSSVLKTSIFSSTYTLFSEYAHSEYLSILQIKQSNLNENNEHSISNAVFALNTIRQINCVIIEFLIDRFSSAKQLHKSLKLDKQMAIQVWSNIAQGRS